MSLRNQMPEPLNPNGYRNGYEARLRGESLWLFNWLEASWRAGWTDAGRALLSGAIRPLPKRRRKRKGSK